MYRNLFFSASLFVLANSSQAMEECIGRSDAATDTQCNAGASIEAAAPAPLGNAFLKYMVALKSDDLKTFLATLSTQQRIKAMPHGKRALQMARSAMPHSITFVGENIEPAGMKGMLKAVGLKKSPMSPQEQLSYGTIDFVKESGVWKVDQLAWSGNEQPASSPPPQDGRNQQQNACAAVTGKPESLPDQDMVKLLPGETQIAKFTLPPKSAKNISYPANEPQQVLFRVAFNGALRCKYGDHYPTGMSVDGKNWVNLFYGGMRAAPVNGAIALSFKSDADEAMSFIVVTHGAQ